MIRLVSLNIEFNRHLDTVSAFLAKELPDVACIQEIYEEHLTLFASALHGASVSFAPITRHTEDVSHVLGTAIFSRLPIADEGVHYYKGTPSSIPDMDSRDPRTFNNKNLQILRRDVVKDGATFRIGTTHFSWTPDGMANERQRTDIIAMLNVLAPLGDIILTGDFNAPRGGEIWSEIAARYKDNIPLHYKTSIDPNLHRAGSVKLVADAHAAGVPGHMVDGLFTTPHYNAENVRLVSGASDHMAVVADIHKAA